MSFQISIKTGKSLHQLATEIHTLLCLPPFQPTAFSGEPYVQFETLGMVVLIHQVDEEERAPEVKQYSYNFDLQLSFSEHKLDTDSLEYALQPYYAQLLSFHLGVETAYREQKKEGANWQIRYHFCRKNQQWNSTILFGEPGWQPAVLEASPSQWRRMQPLL